MGLYLPCSDKLGIQTWAETKDHWLQYHVADYCDLCNMVYCRTCTSEARANIRDTDCRHRRLLLESQCLIRGTLHTPCI